MHNKTYVNVISLEMSAGPNTSRVFALLLSLLFVRTLNSVHKQLLLFFFLRKMMYYVYILICFFDLSG